VVAWESDTLAAPVELIGPFVLHLLAASTATDTDWIVKLSDVAPDGTAVNLTQGWLRASHRTLDARRSRPYRPVPAGTKTQPPEPGKPTAFDIAILPLARRFQTGHRQRLFHLRFRRPRFFPHGRRQAEDLREDRGKRQPARAGVLPGVRYAHLRLCGCARARTV